MSATGRGQRSGGADDFFITPAWAVRRLLEAYALPGGDWLEPGAGDGAVIRAVQTVRSDVSFTAVEKRDVLVGRATPCNWYTLDFLQLGTLKITEKFFDVCIGNPPYKLAREFIEQSFDYALITAFLLRINFLASEERADFWARYPADVYVLPDRPSFCLSVKCTSCSYKWTLPSTSVRPKICAAGCGCNALRVSTSDATEYAWYVWSPDTRARGYGIIHHLKITPKEERMKKLIVDVQEGETEEMARARQALEEINENVPSDLVPGARYALADGRLVYFDGAASRFSFFDATQGSTTHKIRLETKAVQAWPSGGSGAVECVSCKWLIAGEAAEGEQCPFCGAGA